MGMLETAARRRLGPQQRRSQLVAVGMTLLRDRPLGDLALEDVAAAAGISRALPYHYFGTRGEFLIAVLEATAGDFLQATDPAPELPPLERLRAGIGAYVDWVGARPSEFLALTRSAAGAGPALRGVCERCRDALVDRLTLGMGADLAEPLLRLAAAGWAAMTAEMVAAWHRRPAVARADLVALIEQTFLAAVAVASRQIPPAQIPPAQFPPAQAAISPVTRSGDTSDQR
jgi:AcrR family transcriptional regulator